LTLPKVAPGTSRLPESQALSFVASATLWAQKNPLRRGLAPSEYQRAHFIHTHHLLSINI